jgi:uncharacterized membrane protein YccC
MAKLVPQAKIWFAVIAISLGAFLLGLTFWHFGTDPMWALIAFVLVYDPDMRSVWNAGLARLWLTVLGTAIALACVYAFGLHKWLMPLSLALTALICGWLPNPRGAGRIVLVSVALIVGSSLLQPAEGVHIALTRALEVSAGSLLAIAFSSIVARLLPAKPDGM